MNTRFGKDLTEGSAVRVWMVCLWQCQGGCEHEHWKRSYKGSATGEQDAYDHLPYFIWADGIGFGRKNLDGVLMAMSGRM